MYLRDTRNNGVQALGEILKAEEDRSFSTARWIDGSWCTDDLFYVVVLRSGYDLLISKGEWEKLQRLLSNVKLQSEM